MSILADLTAMSAKIAALPPRPRCLMAHHSVPFGKAYKQWMSNGELIVWVNRGMIADLPRAAPATHSLWECDVTPLLGIPVYNA